MQQQKEIEHNLLIENMKNLSLYAYDVLVYSLKEFQTEQPEIPYFYKDVITFIDTINTYILHT